ncbi:MAG: hypothetical protein AAF217_02885 [Pseudomonadota bacterium]
MTSLLIILIGILLIAAGAFGIYSGYSGDEPFLAAMGWGSLIIGALAILYGLGKRVSDNIDTEQREIEDYDKTELRALIQCMGVVATADTKIRDQEVKTISNIHAQMLGITIPDNEILEILSDFGPDFNITKRLTKDRSKISPTMKRLIVQSCHLVMVSDLEIAQTEENRVQEIGLALGFDPNEVEDLIASAGV